MYSRYVRIWRTHFFWVHWPDTRRIGVYAIRSLAFAKCSAPDLHHKSLLHKPILHLLRHRMQMPPTALENGGGKVEKWGKFCQRNFFDWQQKSLADNVNRFDFYLTAHFPPTKKRQRPLTITPPPLSNRPRRLTFNGNLWRIFDCNFCGFPIFPNFTIFHLPSLIAFIYFVRAPCSLFAFALLFSLSVGRVKLIIYKICWQMAKRKGGKKNNIQGRWVGFPPFWWRVLQHICRVRLMKYFSSFGRYLDLIESILRQPGGHFMAGILHPCSTNQTALHLPSRPLNYAKHTLSHTLSQGLSFCVPPFYFAFLTPALKKIYFALGCCFYLAKWGVVTHTHTHTPTRTHSNS